MNTTATIFDTGYAERHIDALLNPSATTRDEVENTLNESETAGWAWMLTMRTRELVGVAQRGIWTDGTAIPAEALGYIRALVYVLLAPSPRTD
jgi:hypothetical protein